MQYLSGIHALNLNCELETCGDWHQSAIQWERLKLYESNGSLWGDYGIETDKRIPEHTELFNTANHIRALLDLLYEGKFSVAQGMRKDFICTDKYNDEIFDKVSMMIHLPNWKDIDEFMCKEYKCLWLDFKEEKNNGT